MPLIKTTTLDFIRAGTDGGYFQGGVFIEPSDTPPIKALGSLQPLRKLSEGDRKIIEERGYLSDNSFVFYTETSLVGVDEFLKTVPDKTTIRGQEYEVSLIKPWIGFDSELDHYSAVLSRKSLK